MSMTASAMDSLAIDEFVRSRSVGVLAMARDDDAYAVPVSYAYADAGPDLYFRLGYGPTSQKRPFVAAVDRATFVVCDRDDGAWKSVVAEGRLETVSTSSIDNTVLESIEGLRIPFFQVHRQPAADLEFEIVRLDIDRLSGVAEPQRAVEATRESGA